MLEGITYLQMMDDSHICRGAAGTAEQPSCGRISCSLDSAIWNCNHNDREVEYPCRLFGDYASGVHEHCTNWALPMGWVTSGHQLDRDFNISAYVGHLDGHC